MRSEVAGELEEWAEKLTAAADGWPNRAALAPAVEAVAESAAILSDAATELVKPPRERVRA